MRLSVFEAPLSEVESRSGRIGTTGAKASIVIESGKLGAEVLPAVSVVVPVTNHVPLESVGRSHDVEIPTTYVHDWLIDPLVAVIVAI